MTKILVTVDWRTAAQGWPGGQLYLLDLEAHKVLDHFVGSLEPEGLCAPGGWGGFRGVFYRNGRAFVADADSIRVFRVLGSKLHFQRAWTARRFYDIHDTWLDPDGSWWITSTGTDEVVKVRAWRPGGAESYTLEALHVWDALLDASVPRDLEPNRPPDARRFDMFHINAVAGWGAERWALLHAGGHVVRFAPGPTFVHPYKIPSGHSIRCTPGGQLLCLDTLNERVIVLDRAGGAPRHIIDCRAHRTAGLINPNTGKRAESGWLRGCAVLDGRRAVVGTSPAQLFVVNYATGEVEDHWVIDASDVRASTFGIDVIR